MEKHNITFMDLEVGDWFCLGDSEEVMCKVGDTEYIQADSELPPADAPRFSITPETSVKRSD